MRYWTATESRRNTNKLFEEAANGPITILKHGRPVVVVMSLDEYHKLMPSPKPRTPGTGANVLANVDVDQLLSTPIDDLFADYM